MMTKHTRRAQLSRREFLFGAVASGLTLALNRWSPDSTRTYQSALPQAAFSPNRVVHTHSNDATFWDYSTGWYGDYVSQTMVDAMTDRGLMALTDTATIADAWHAIIPTYATGQKVAIKINLNNATCSDSDQVIDALPQPTNSVIRGLKAIGVSENNIWVYDVTNGFHSGQIPARLVNKVTALYPNVQFHAYSSACSTALGYSATEKIHFNVPPGKPAITDRPICNALVNASYLINLPIMKKHVGAGVTLAFKNHFGSFDRCDFLHWSTDVDDPQYTSTYNVLVDIYNNLHFKNKTVLTIGDGLYGGRFHNYEVPSRWSTFGNKAPNSLFFSIDPVAIDCVMCDFLNDEGGVMAHSDDYLKLADAQGFGTFEHWNSQHQYSAIDYRRIEVSLTGPSSTYLPLIYLNP